MNTIFMIMFICYNQHIEENSWWIALDSDKNAGWSYDQKTTLECYITNNYCIKGFHMIWSRVTIPKKKVLFGLEETFSKNLCQQK